MISAPQIRIDHSRQTIQLFAIHLGDRLGRPASGGHRRSASVEAEPQEPIRIGLSPPLLPASNEFDRLDHRAPTCPPSTLKSKFPQKIPVKIQGVALNKGSPTVTEEAMHDMYLDEMAARL